ncbi:MAG: DNA-binding protein [Gammaproteobacteria bacterium]|nr:MAG: DNA-binding protein [Gammaproteobacteria bacterium]
MEFKDYYAALGVAPDADDKTIKKAFRKLAHQYHPDMNKDAGAEDKFKEVAEAYEVLHNTEKRAEYDELRTMRSRRQQSGSHQQTSGFNTGGGQENYQESDIDFADFFNSMFGGARGRQTNQGGFHNSNHAKGRDLEIEWPINLEDTLADTSKRIEYAIPDYDNYGQPHDVKKSLNIKIPAGTRDGERIRIKGQGAPGIGNAPSGDLYLHIRLIPHPLFDIEGHNLIIAVPLAPWEAILGTKVTLPTLTGKINLTIPPNSQAGQRLRIKGKGLIGKLEQGDLIAAIKIVTPKTATEDEKKLWTQLAEKTNFNPRTEWSN